MRTNALSGLSLLTLSLLLAGCSLAPVHQRPEAPIPAAWPVAHSGAELVTPPAQAATAPDVVMRDWQAFIVDPQLQALVDEALANNRSLRQTLLDIEQARAQYRIQRADRVPNLNAAASGTRQRLPADLSADGRGGVTRSYQVALSLPEYELDLFGRVRNLSAAALEQYLATEEAGRSARIALVAEVAQAYVEHDGAQRRLALTRQTLESRESSLALVRQRREAGVASALDHQEAMGLVEQARAELESNERQKRQAFNALVLLVGSGDLASRLPATPQAQPLVLQDITAGTPSQLIERRPDILAAEHRLKARNADIGAARAAFFPRISLTGAYGSSSAELSGLFDGGSRAWSFMPSLTLPIFAGGRNRAGLDLAEVRKEAAVAAYEGTIQTAFREVADALAATDTLRRETGARAALAESSRETLKLSRARYEGGVDSHLRYLDAQRSNFNEELALIQIGTQQQAALVDLFRALGGGWTAGAAPEQVQVR